MTGLAVHPCAILAFWALARCCCVAGLESTRDGLGHHEIDTAAAAAAAAASGSTAATNLAENNVKGAALHCIALDESGEFPINRVLGLFEVAPLQADTPPTGKLGISKAEVEFAVRRRHEDENLHDSGGGGGGGGGGAGGDDAGPAAICVNVILEVALGGGVSSAGQDGTEKAAGAETLSGTGNGIGGRSPSSVE
ncbi:unnamed protein product, partial [Laminaria digitata]